MVREHKTKNVIIVVCERSARDSSENPFAQGHGGRLQKIVADSPA